MLNGEYITFVDADDFVEVDSYLKCMRLINENNIDILRFGFYYLNKETKIKNEFDIITDKVINRDEYNELIFKNLLLTEDFSCIWNVIFKREILGDLRFNSNVKYGEDLLFSYELLLRSSSMMVINEPLYNYENNASGASKYISIKKCLSRLNDEIYVDEKICELFSNYVNLENYANFRINNCFNYNLKCIAKEGYKKYKEYLKEAENLNIKYIDKRYIKKQNNYCRYLVYRLIQFLKSIKRRG